MLLYIRFMKSHKFITFCKVYAITSVSPVNPTLLNIWKLYALEEQTECVRFIIIFLSKLIISVFMLRSETHKVRSDSLSSA